MGREKIAVTEKKNQEEKKRVWIDWAIYGDVYTPPTEGEINILIDLLYLLVIDYRRNCFADVFESNEEVASFEM